MDKSVREILDELNIEIKNETSSDFIVQCWNTAAHRRGDINPSMGIHKELGMYHCWSCHESGHIAGLYKKKTGKFLGNKDPKDLNYTNTDRSKKSKKDADIVLVEGSLESPYKRETVMNFLRGIGVYNDDFIDFYNIKYAHFAKFQSVTSTDKPTTFYRRITIPVYSSDGKLISIEGRDITGNKDTKKVIYPKGSVTDHIFNIDNVNNDEPLVVVEGIKDLMKIWNVHRNVVSIFSNNWTERKLQLLVEGGFTNNIILFIDNDEAGVFMADKFSDLWNHDFKVCYNPVLGGDANDCSLTEIKSLVSNAKDYTSWVYEDTIKRRDFSW